MENVSTQKKVLIKKVVPKQEEPVPTPVLQEEQAPKNKKKTKLAKLIFESGMSQKEVAALTGINQSVLSNIVNGNRKRDMNLNYAQRLSQLFGITIEELLA